MLSYVETGQNWKQTNKQTKISKMKQGTFPMEEKKCEKHVRFPKAKSEALNNKDIDSHYTI